MQKHSSFRTALPTACFPPPPASVRDSVICSCTQITFSLQLTQKAKRVRDTPGRGAEDSSKVLAVSGRLPHHRGRQASLGPPRVPLPGMPPAPGGLLTWVLFALDCRHLTHFNILAGSEICFLLSPQLKKKSNYNLCEAALGPSWFWRLTAHRQLGGSSRLVTSRPSVPSTHGLTGNLH